MRDSSESLRYRSEFSAPLNRFRLFVDFGSRLRRPASCSAHLDRRASFQAQRIPIIPMDSSISHDEDESTGSLSKSQRLQVIYNDALRNTDIIVKDEGARRLRLRILMLENENDDLHQQLAIGDDHIDALEHEADDLRVQLEQTQEDAHHHDMELKVQTRELNNLKTELASMNGVAMDTTKLLTEKLSLARELATLKPELDHLCSQVAQHQMALSEKLALQRQVNSLEVELETEKRAAKRAAQKNDHSEREAEFQSQLDGLQKDLARTKREASKTLKERETEFQAELDTLQKDLARERRENSKTLKELEKELKASEARQAILESKAAQNHDNSEREAELQGQLDALQKELSRERKESARSVKELEKELKASEARQAILESKAAQKHDDSERETDLQDKIDALQRDLTRERKESSKSIKELEKELKISEARQKALGNKATQENDSSEREAELQAQVEELQQDLARVKKEDTKALKELENGLKESEIRQTALEGKFEQMRTKLRTTKEQLKECHDELAQARAIPSKARNMSKSEDAPVKNLRKRSAPEMSTDVTIGTPDGVAVRGKRPGMKRGRMDQTMLGEKSMFSITPFLNRTTSIAPESPIQNSPIVEKESAADKRPSNTMQNEPLTAVLPTPDISSPTVTPKARGRKKLADKGDSRNVLGEAKTNIKKTKSAPKKRPLSTLEKVTEEDGDENEQSNVRAPENAEPTEQPQANVKASKLQAKHPAVEESGPKKKKRKLPGATLFDEEDGETTKRPAKVSLGPARLLGKGPVALKGGLGASAGFGAFSPLKKDRRDDNVYAKVTPSLNLTCDADGLRIDCNETGFTAKNVDALCTIGQSTKAGLQRATRYVGEKGIGFKSVFKAADVLWISSGGYTFKLDTTTLLRSLGMITPIWAEFPGETFPGHTSLYMKFSPAYDKRSSLMTLLNDRGKVSSSMLTRTDDQRNGDLIVSLSGDQKSDRYLVKSQNAIDLPLEDK
ncbi:hypothetical protein G7Y89_g1093 [Cudoniella acicularis]|uniref:Uncharacterized protein n=1 Tax=Cudoniella acicularis TaxID=354080 RepID=A0A8H4RX02_9HELO|nr:hypothetical protein G7Y89_g1093 [Cudoniella acicularis]